MNIIITGYTGFVGQFLVPKIIKNFKYEKLVLISRKKNILFKEKKILFI